MIDVDLVSGVLLAAAGIAAGFINTLAGGGSFLTLPVLMLMGLPADQANGTIRPSVLTQSVASTAGFHRYGRLDTAAIVGILAPSGLGSLAGAGVATIVPNEFLKPLLLAIMVAMAFAMMVRPGLIAPPPDVKNLTVRDRPIAVFWLFGAGFYGGFVQAGVGFLILAILGPILRYDLVRANAIKMVITTVFGILPLAVFVAADLVVWVPATILAVATVAGSWLGVRFAVDARPDHLRALLFVVVVSIVGIELFQE